MLWDWDSYFSNVALKQILIDAGTDVNEAQEYERGCVLNFLSFTDCNGFMPPMVAQNSDISTLRPKDMLVLNMIYWYEGREYTAEF